MLEPLPYCRVSEVLRKGESDWKRILPVSNCKTVPVRLHNQLQMYIFQLDKVRMIQTLFSTRKTQSKRQP